MPAMPPRRRSRLGSGWLTLRRNRRRFMCRTTMGRIRIVNRSYLQQQYARGLEQDPQDEAKPVVTQREAPILEHACVATLDRPAAPA